jgi:uncharacterized damage-inducible protein DinB
MSDGLLTLYRHKTWATLRLIEYCQGIDGAHLDATTPGTYGTIRETLRHLVQTEEGYLFRVTGERLSEPIRDGIVALDELAERIRRIGPRWEVVALDADLPDRDVITSDGWRVPAAIPMAQAIHHADDHRSHVMTILGALSLDVPEPNGLDLWGYAEVEGLMEKVDDPTSR